ncbi:imidazolonepropionase [Mycobacterium tuberculosis]|nr:imidazolonepropionase [Mycobacterium tuberculosis]
MLKDTSITITDGTVSAVGGEEPPGAEAIDLTGCWATPSLVDMHTHLTFDPRAHRRSRPAQESTNGVQDASDGDELIGFARAMQSLSEALRSGICLVRDAGGREAPLRMVKTLLASDGVIAPELVTCGEPLCLPDGHGLAFGRTLGPVDGLPRLLDEHRNRGHEWLKIMNGPELWPRPRLTEIIQAAHMRGLKVAVHAFTSDGIRDAVLSGADSVEHAMVADDDVTNEARRRGTFFVPTYYCAWLSLRERFTWTQTRVELGHLAYWLRYMESCRQAHVENRLPALPGTDAGCAPCSFDDYVEELVEFESWGLAPISVLRIAALEAAAALGRADRFGSISSGKWANIIVTESAPTDTVRALEDPLLILFKGIEVYNRMGKRWI